VEKDFEFLVDLDNANRYRSVSHISLSLLEVRNEIKVFSQYFLYNIPNLGVTKIFFF